MKARENVEDPIVIVATQRTPIGEFQGALSHYTGAQLGSLAIQAALQQIHLPQTTRVSEVLMGCVLPAGMGQAPARQAALGAGLNPDVGATTINKMCGSGMKALMLAYDHLHVFPQDMVIAGGMESMSNAPYLLSKARKGYRLGHGTLFDHLLLDGLEDAYERGTLMGVFAERCAKDFGFSRKIQDEYALRSLERAQHATKAHLFEKEMSPINNTLQEDELLRKATPEKIPRLKPAFQENGTITAANASAISDGAAVHVLMRYTHAQRIGLKPLAHFIAHASIAQAPQDFPTAPIHAIKKLLKHLDWEIKDIDLFEINEAFAVVVLAASQALSVPIEKINVHGGACALGHPIGASGARIVTTLIYALIQRGLKRGIASLCLGGGEAVAMAIEIH